MFRGTGRTGRIGGQVAGATLFARQTTQGLVDKLLFLSQCFKLAGQHLRPLILILGLAEFLHLFAVKLLACRGRRALPEDAAQFVAGLDQHDKGFTLTLASRRELLRAETVDAPAHFRFRVVEEFAAKVADALEPLCQSQCRVGEKLFERDVLVERPLIW